MLDLDSDGFSSEAVDERYPNLSDADTVDVIQIDRRLCSDYTYIDCRLAIPLFWVTMHTGKWM